MTHRLPQARTELAIYELADEVLIYDPEGHKGHCLNQTAALVWKHCDGQTSLTDMVNILQQELKTPVDSEVIWLALNQLGKARLLTEPVTRPDATQGLSRRSVMRKIGWAAAVALPLVTSMVVPPPSHAATCTASGQPCITSAQCCSGVCNMGTCV